MELEKNYASILQDPLFKRYLHKNPSELWSPTIQLLNSSGIQKSEFSLESPRLAEENLADFQSPIIVYFSASTI